MDSSSRASITGLEKIHRGRQNLQAVTLLRATHSALPSECYPSLVLRHRNSARQLKYHPPSGLDIDAGWDVIYQKKQYNSLLLYCINTSQYIISPKDYNNIGGNQPIKVSLVGSGLPSPYCMPNIYITRKCRS